MPGIRRWGIGYLPQPAQLVNVVDGLRTLLAGGLEVGGKLEQYGAQVRPQPLAALL